MEWWKCWWTTRLIEDLNPIFGDQKLTIDKKGKAWKNMVIRKKKKLVILKRLGLRKASTSRLLTLGNVDKNFTL